MEADCINSKNVDTSPFSFRRVVDAYTASLTPTDTLLRMPVEDLGDLLQSEEYDRGLRPRLYDLLAHRALAVYTNSETRVDPNPLGVSSWTIDGTSTSSSTSCTERWSTAIAPLGSSSHQHLQRLERVRLSHHNPDALVDVMLQRLAFVRTRSTVSNKEAARQCPGTLRTRLVNDTSWADRSRSGDSTYHVDKASR